MQQVEIGHGSEEKFSVNNQSILSEKAHSELFFSLLSPNPVCHDLGSQVISQKRLEKTFSPWSFLKSQWIPSA